jgi:putative hemolysin
LKKYFKIGIISGILIVIAVSVLFLPVTRNMETKLGNTASKYCLEHGGLSVIQSSDNGTQQGLCQFSDGSVCDEWQYFRGECHPTS